MINECTAAFGNFKNKRLLVKNRDKTYRPNIEVRHEILNGTEVLYYQDIDINHLEGMNEHGIGLIYTTSNMQKDDEADKFTNNIEIIKKALSLDNIKDVVRTVSSMNGGVKGVMLVSSPEGSFQVENMAEAGPEKFAGKLVQPAGWHVITNVPSMLSAGLDPSSGENYICCKIRQAVAEASLYGVSDLDEALESMAYKYFSEDSHHNVLRDSEFEQTVLQVGMDLDSKEMKLVRVPNKVNSFKVFSDLPSGYEPKCRFLEKKFTDPALAPFKIFTDTIEESIQRFNLVNYLNDEGPEIDLENLEDKFRKKVEDKDKTELAQHAADQLWEKEKILISLIRKLGSDPIFFTAGHTSSQVKKEIDLLKNMVKKIGSDYEKILDFIYFERYGEERPP